MAHDVFISYSSEDKPIADAVCATMEQHRIRCWIAPRDVLPGINYGESIVNAINDCRVVILVFSSAANASPQVLREVERSVSKAKPIIPFRIADIEPTKSMEYFLSSPHWLDAITPPMEMHLNKLLEVVQAIVHLERPPLEMPNEQNDVNLLVGKPAGFFEQDTGRLHKEIMEALLQIDRFVRFDVPKTLANDGMIEPTVHWSTIITNCRLLLQHSIYFSSEPSVAIEECVQRIQTNLNNLLDVYRKIPFSTEEERKGPLLFEAQEAHQMACDDLRNDINNIRELLSRSE